MRPLLISLRPCYADSIFEGLKRVEFRRRIVSPVSERDVFIYVSSPALVLRGGFRVGQVWSGSPEDVWLMVSTLAGVDKWEFDAYFEGQAVAYALEIRDVWEYQRPVSLKTLRSRFENFVVPQSWRYVTTVEAQAFERLARRPQKGSEAFESALKSTCIVPELG